MHRPTLAEDLMTVAAASAIFARAASFLTSLAVGSVATAALVAAAASATSPARHILLDTSGDAISIKKRGIKMRADDVAGSICRARPSLHHWIPCDSRNEG